MRRFRFALQFKEIKDSSNAQFDNRWQIDGDLFDSLFVLSWTYIVSYTKTIARTKSTARDKSNDKLAK